MKLHVVSIRDAALDAYMRPIFVPSVGIAVRSFDDEVNRADSEMGKHPEDYELFVIGTWDEETGIFENVERRSVARGKELKKL